jgi:hypothetical protein
MGLRGHACARAQLPVPEAESGSRDGEGGSGTRTGGGHGYLSSFVGCGAAGGGGMLPCLLPPCELQSRWKEWITDCYSLLPLSSVGWAYSFLDWVGPCP